MITSEDINKNYELVLVIVIIFIVMATYYFYLWREYKKETDTYQVKKEITLCPDYWTLLEHKNIPGQQAVVKCQNTKKIGGCNMNSPKDFGSKLYFGDTFEKNVAKCKWSKYCNAPWEGIDHLCADMN
jgi:hypothetical protein